MWTSCVHVARNVCSSSYFIENAFVFKNGLDILPFSMKNYIIFKTLAFFYYPTTLGCASRIVPAFEGFDPLLIQRL